MKGAIAEPLVSTINTPKRRRINIVGSSQYFFRFFKNENRSFKNSIHYSNMVKLIGNFNIFFSECYIPDLHYSFFILFEIAQLKTILP